MSTLRDFQRVFAEAVRGTGSDAVLEARVAGGEGARSRIAVYRTAYIARLCDAVRDDYPKVAIALGDRFLPVVREYVAKHPSDQPSLRHFGRHLPDFLEAPDARTERPWLADLARLEWARVEAFDAADRTPMSFRELRTLQHDRWPHLRLEPVPSFRMLRLAWNVDDLWSVLDDDSSSTARDPELTAVAVWRTGFVVRHRVCHAEEVRAIALLQGLAPFSAICEAFAESSRDGVDDAAHRAFTALTQWVADGWIGSLLAEPDRHARGRAIAARTRE